MGPEACQSYHGHVYPSGLMCFYLWLQSQISAYNWMCFGAYIKNDSPCFQVTLGISTLLLYVPVSLGVAHQAGALSLFTSVIALLHALRKPSPAVLKSISRPSSKR